MGQTLACTVLWKHPHDSTPSSIKYSFNGSVDKWEYLKQNWTMQMNSSTQQLLKEAESFTPLLLNLPCSSETYSLVISSLLNIVWVVKSRRMRWVGHVARMGEGCTGFWWGNLRERDHWEDPDADGRLILRWIFRKWEGVVVTGWSWLRIGTGGGHLWVRWWTFGFQKCGEFLD